MAQATRKRHFETLQLHAGQYPDPITNARAVPIYATSSFTFKSTKHGKALFDMSEAGHVYSRISNPTVEVFERRIAALERGTAAVGCASGHAAQFLAIAALAGVGDNIVSSTYLYGGTYNQFKHTLPRLGIDVRIVASDLLEDFEKKIDDRTKAVYIETIGNPTYNVLDIRAFADMAHRHGVVLVVDNTFGCGGYLCAPIEFGADVVTLSATKWVGGHGVTLGGAVVEAGTFDWAANRERYPEINAASESYHGLEYVKTFGRKALSARIRSEFLRDLGPTLSPFSAFLLLQGIETLSFRVDRHVQNTLALAQWLEKHPQVQWCNYPGLKSHRTHGTAKKYLPRGFGGVLSFGVKGGAPAGSIFIDSVKLVSHLANVGDAKTLAIHPWTTTHSQLTDFEKVQSGVTEDLIRISVGLEHIDDIIADFEQALEKCTKGGITSPPKQCSTPLRVQHQLSSKL